MDRQEARIYVRGQMENYLLQKGLPINKHFHCLNPNHSDNNPSMHYDHRRQRVHCFSCGEDYDIFDIIKIEYGLNEMSDVFKKAYEIFGIELDVTGTYTPKCTHRTTYPYTHTDVANSKISARISPPRSSSKNYHSYFIRCQDKLEQTDYPAQRGLSKEICLRYGLGYDPHFKSGRNGPVWQALIIPTSEESFTARNTDPDAEKGERVRKRGGSPIYGSEFLWDSDQPLFIVEGEIDALCLRQVGARALAFGSTANVGSFLRLVTKRKPAPLLLIALDNDIEGQKASNQLQEGLKNLSIPFQTINPYGNHKDAGEALLVDAETLISEIKQALNTEQTVIEAEREDYLHTSVFHHLKEFTNGIADSAATPHLPTGFSKLDNILEGGLFEGLYIMGGISSLGKTSLALQLADQLAESGQDTLIFSLEMARSELMAKSISRLTLLEAINCQDSSLAKTARGLTCGSRYALYSKNEMQVINRALKHYENFARQLFINEGVGDIGVDNIRLEIDKHLRHTGRVPVVIVDYLQILAPYNERSTDKQNIDKAVLELKRISRDFKIPVLAISSFNRANYREQVTMEAFKESGAIEYSSDVLIGLQFKGAGEKDFNAFEAKEKNPRDLEVVILKNRHGVVGRKIFFQYYSQFNYFKELG